MPRCIPWCLLLFLASAGVGSAQTFTNGSARILASPTGDDALAVTVADFNGDGRSDLYYPGRLLVQGTDGSYRDALLGSAISVEGNAPLVALPGDPNADGLTDLLIVDRQPGSRYYENTNTIRYRLANGERSLNIRTQSIGAAWGNFDGEGGIDVYVASSDGQNRLFLSSLNDDFTDVSDTKRSQSAAGVCGLAVNDFDHDLDLDVYLPMCQNNTVNELLEYDSVRDRYNNVANREGVSSFRFSHSAVWFDYNNDGWDDLFVVNARFDIENGQNQLFRNDSGTGFTEVAGQAGLLGSQPEPRRGVAAADFDNDGWTDLYISYFETSHRLFRNLGDGTFEDVTRARLPSQPNTEAFAAADVDDNGWIDLVYHQPEGVTLLMNDGAANWTHLSLRAPGRNRRGLGARVTVTAGTLTQTKQMTMGGGNPRHAQDARLHFGLAGNEVIDRIDVVWQDGTTDVLTDQPVNQELVISKGGQLNPAPSAFDLLGPEDGAFYDTSAAAIDLSWGVAQD
ncbi:MAG: CRTAC1 family protein, partial [Rhodothermales bacterium]|nr:CRTAC1 family protein [Rhodothermales bacterium]